MRITPLVLAVALVAGTTANAFAAHSDYTKSFPLSSLRTFQFKEQSHISRSPLADNTIWANDVRSAIRAELASRGITEVAHGQPDFYVTFSVGLKDKVDINTIGYGMPSYRGGFRRGGWGWRPAYGLWSVPYTESTVVVNIIDAHTNQLVWRGYDADTLNNSKPDKTLSKAVDNVMSHFFKDVKKQPA